MGNLGGQEVILVLILIFLIFVGFLIFWKFPAFMKKNGQGGS
jgi:uncharacterized membrane protein YqiK